MTNKSKYDKKQHAMIISMLIGEGKTIEELAAIVGCQGTAYRYFNTIESRYGLTIGNKNKRYTIIGIDEESILRIIFDKLL